MSTGHINALRIKSRALAATLAIAAFLVIVATAACGSDSTPSSNETPAGGADNSRPALGTDRMSLDEYTEWCSGMVSIEDPPEGITYGEYSSGVAEFIEEAESINPPVEVAEWHNAAWSVPRAMKSLADAQPKDDVVDALAFFTPSILSLGEDMEKAKNNLAPEVLERLVEAGCIGPDLSMGDTDAALDMLNEVENLLQPGTGIEISVGDRVNATLDEPGEPRKFLFQAEEGKHYLIEVGKGTLPDFWVTVGNSSGWEMTGPFDDERFLMPWIAPMSGQYFVQVSPASTSGDFTGAAYTISVRLDTRPTTPVTAQYGREGLTMRVSWDAVDGADSYAVYHDGYYLDSACQVSRDGRPSHCEELATNVIGTRFIHADPNPDANYYWVVACSEGDCMAVDSGNPALPVGDGPGGPTSGGPCRTGVTLEPGEFCAVVMPGVRGKVNLIETRLFEVRNGRGCYGDICSDDIVNLDGFIASPERAGSWSVTSLPADLGEALCSVAAPVTESRVRILKILVEAGADIDWICHENPVLYWAMQGANGNYDIVQILVDAGANVDAENEAGNPVLYRAIGRDDSTLVQILVDAGANVNAEDKDGNPVLYRAMQGANGNYDIVQILVDAGANVDAKDAKGRRPMLYWAMSDSTLMKILVDAGANVNAEDEDGNPVLYRAMQGANGNYDIVQILVDAGANVDAKDAKGRRSMLYWAMSDSTLMKILVDAGANVNAEDEDGNPVLYRAMQGANGNYDIVQMLVDAGANVNAEDEDGNPMLFWAMSEDPTLVQMLVDAGANVNATDSDGNSMLFWATIRDFPEIASILVAGGAR